MGGVSPPNSVLGLHNLSIEYHNGKNVYINEPGLYALILRSKAPLANQFQYFICGVVLPSIRKYGQYIHSQQLALEFEEKLMLKDKQRQEAEHQLLLKNAQHNAEAKQRQEAEQALIQVRAEAEFQSRYTNKLKDMITVMKSRQKDEIIYIATTKATQVLDFDEMDENSKKKFVSTIFQDFAIFKGEDALFRKDFEEYVSQNAKAKFNKRVLWSYLKQILPDTGKKIKY